MAILRFDDPRTLVLKYDDAKAVDGKYGTQYMWSVEPDDVFYATPALNALIMSSNVKSGDRVTIAKATKEDVNGNTITFFTVNGKSMDDIKNNQNVESMELPTALQDEPVPDFLEPNKPTDGIDARLDAIEDRIKKLEDESNPIPM